MFEFLLELNENQFWMITGILILGWAILTFIIASSKLAVPIKILFTALTTLIIAIYLPIAYYAIFMS